MKRKWLLAGAAVLVQLLTFGCVAMAEEAVPELTIWVDQDSEWVVRTAIVNYEWLSGGYGSGNEYFPELTWRIEDKSCLTPAQIRQELLTKLQEGGGPDLIYLDEYNGISPELLMESGYLLELQDITKKTLFEGKFHYLPGALEAGQMEGRQYVLPVFAQCPFVFGAEAALSEAGIDTENGYQNLSEFLDALIAAAEKSGKQIFESTRTVDWIEQYCLMTEEDTSGLEMLLEEVRAHCGSENSFFSPSESLGNGESLLSGCGLESIQKLSQNLAMMDKKESISFLPIPSWDGEIRAVIGQSAAINVNTRYPKEANALIRMFQESYINSSYTLRKYLPAVYGGAYWQSILDSSLFASDTLYEKRGRIIASGDQLNRRLRKNTMEAVTDTVFLPADTETEESLARERKVLTIGFEDRGMGEEYPIYQWLQDTAEKYSDEDVYVQLITTPAAHGSAFNFYEMDNADVGTDVVLILSTVFAADYPYPEYAEYITDLTPYLKEETKELRLVRSGEEIKGIAYGVLTTEDYGTRDYVFAVTKKSELKEEAVDFCLKALQNEKYEAAVEAAGIGE